MISKCLFFGLISIVPLLLSSCSDENIQTYDSEVQATTELDPKSIQPILSKTIYFAHMSVGKNIMDGMETLFKEIPNTTFTIRETNQLASTKQGMFAHAPIGDNKYPLKKIANFVDQINSGIGNAADIAFFKFCYIDMKADQNVEEVFQTYKKTMSSLSKQYPETTFVHVTVPLTVVQTGWKVPLKKAIGKTPGGYMDNINRNRFNELVIDTYSGKEPVFDLARIESTTPTGEQTTFEHKGTPYLSMYSGYASDGRHLNPVGSRYVAQQLLYFLSKI